MSTRPFPKVAHAALEGTPINNLLATNDAVILERIAMGGGATSWYHCPDQTRLEAVEAQLRPGSVVSFYFDGRIRSALLSSNLKPDLEKIINETGDVVFGFLNEDQLHVDVEIVTGLQELDESALANRLIFYGPFPARDNDGVRAVTVTLPDADGIVRPHPH